MTTDGVNVTLSYRLETCGNLWRMLRFAMAGEMPVGRVQATGVRRASLKLRDAPCVEAILITDICGTFEIVDCVANCGCLGLEDGDISLIQRQFQIPMDSDDERTNAPGGSTEL